jgi:hypothetical protein
MELAVRDLLQAVDRERESRQMSDRKFSMEVLGISPAYFCLLKAGKRPITGNLAVLFLQKLPEITPVVTSFIMGKGNDGENQETPPKSIGVETPGGREMYARPHQGAF